MTRNLCFAGYDMGNGERCKVCKATSNESCRRGYEVVNRLEGQRDQLLAACKAAEERIVKLYAGIGPSANRDDGSNGHAEQDDVIHMIRDAIAAAEPKP